MLRRRCAGHGRGVGCCWLAIFINGDPRRDGEVVVVGAVAREESGIVGGKGGYRATERSGRAKDSRCVHCSRCDARALQLKVAVRARVGPSFPRGLST